MIATASSVVSDHSSARLRAPCLYPRSTTLRAYSPGGSVFEQPQLMTFPVCRLAPDVTCCLPQSQLQSQQTCPKRLLATRSTTTRLPYRLPVRSLKFSGMPLREQVLHRRLRPLRSQ